MQAYIKHSQKLNAVINITHLNTDWGKLGEKIQFWRISERRGFVSLWIGTCSVVKMSRWSDRSKMKLYVLESYEIMHCKNLRQLIFRIVFKHVTETYWTALFFLLCDVRSTETYWTALFFLISAIWILNLSTQTDAPTVFVAHSLKEVAMIQY
jgi:hypothetical protein